MRTNTDLTLYSKSIVASAEVYTRSVIAGVQWEDRRAANARLPGDVKADSIAVYIPMSHGGSGIAEGDLIVRGVVADEISGAFTPTSLKAKYPNTSGRVRTVDRMDLGSEALSHWQIGAS